jgi:hypothetical protein
MRSLSTGIIVAALLLTISGAAGQHSGKFKPEGPKIDQGLGHGIDRSPLDDLSRQEPLSPSQDTVIQQDNSGVVGSGGGGGHGGHGGHGHGSHSQCPLKCDYTCKLAYYPSGGPCPSQCLYEESSC